MLALFSFIGAIRVVPHLLLAMYERGIYYTICEDPVPHYGHGAAGLWSIWFVFSKVGTKKCRVVTCIFNIVVVVGS